MKIEELKDEEMYAFFAPDGSWQSATTAPDFETCMGLSMMLSSTGICKHPTLMFKEGFKILPLKVSITANGTEEEGFQRAKERLS